MRLLPLSICAILANAALAGEPAATVGGRVILDESRVWRAFYTWKTAVVRTKSGLRGTDLINYTAKSPPAPRGWMAERYGRR